VLGAILPEHAWQQGFCSRTIFAFSDEIIPFDTKIFRPRVLPTRDPSQWCNRSLASRLEAMVQKRSRMDLTDGRRESNSPAGPRTGFAPVPQHEKLADYAGRRWQQVYSISLSSAPPGEIELQLQEMTFNGRDNCLRTQSWDINHSFLNSDVLTIKMLSIPPITGCSKDSCQTKHAGKINGSSSWGYNAPSLSLLSFPHSVDRFVAPHRVDSFVQRDGFGGLDEEYPIRPGRSISQKISDPWYAIGQNCEAPLKDA
jgi:hypothetical protein